MNVPTPHPTAPTIIGGMFGLETGPAPAPVALPPILARPALELATARSALTLLVQTLRPANVWLPAYLCSAMLDAVPPPRRFFPISETLEVGDDTWLREVGPADLVVFIDYFGFRSWEEHAAVASDHGAWIVEDACHALANASFSVHAHYVIASPRKFVGVPDGGLLLAQRGRTLPATALPAISAAWWPEAVQASLARAQFDQHGGARTWFELFQRAEARISAEPARMSDLSARLLRYAIDWPELARRRRTNYMFLAEALRPVALLPDLPAGIVPLGFPVVVPNRNAVREKLFAENIFPPVHWPFDAAVPAFRASRRLAARIMTIPCDQRYAPQDLQRVVACLRQADIL